MSPGPVPLGDAARSRVGAVDAEGTEIHHIDRFESVPERLIREAIEAGDFDNLPGEGKPLPDAGSSDDELWWVRAWLKRNRVTPRSGPPPAPIE